MKKLQFAVVFRPFNVVVQIVEKVFKKTKLDVVFWTPMLLLSGRRITRQKNLRIFQIPCRFSALNVAVRGWREKTRKDLRQAEEQRRKRDAKSFSEKCRFGGSKVAVRE